MIIYDINSIANNINNSYLFKYPFQQIEISKIIEISIKKIFLNSNFSKELNILRPILVNILSTHINLINKINEINTIKEKKNFIIDKSQSVIASSIIDNKIIDEDKLINLQKKIYNRKKYFKSVKNFLYINFFINFYDDIVFSQNELSSSYLKYIKKITFDTNNLFPIILEENIKSKNISNELIDEITKNLSEKYFTLTFSQKETLKNVSNLYFNRLFNNLDKNNLDISFNRGYISNSQNYYNRITAFILKDRIKSLNGFDHGGDKIFYDNFSYYENELEYVHNYSVFGTKYVKHLNSFKKNQIKVNYVKSLYNNKLYNDHFNRKKTNKNIILLAGAIDGERSGNIYQQDNDDLNKIKFLYILRNTLVKNFKFKIKFHPKSRININNKFFDRYEVTNKNLLSLFQSYNIFIMDYLGTILKECLCAGKEVIYFDHGIYKLNNNYYNELSKVIHIIPLNYKTNLISFDNKLLEFALNNKKSSKKEKFDFINKYYL